MTRREPATLGQRLAELIDLDGRYQSEIAAAAGVTTATLNRIIRDGVERPNAQDVARIGRALGLSPTALGRILYESDPQ